MSEWLTRKPKAADALQLVKYILAIGYASALSAYHASSSPNLLYKRDRAQAGLGATLLVGILLRSNADTIHCRKACLVPSHRVGLH